MTRLASIAITAVLAVMLVSLLIVEFFRWLV